MQLGRGPIARKVYPIRSREVIESSPSHGMRQSRKCPACAVADCAHPGERHHAAAVMAPPPLMTRRGTPQPEHIKDASHKAPMSSLRLQLVRGFCDRTLQGTRAGSPEWPPLLVRWRLLRLPFHELWSHSEGCRGTNLAICWRLQRLIPDLGLGLRLWHGDTTGPEGPRGGRPSAHSILSAMSTAAFTPPSSSHHISVEGRALSQWKHPFEEKNATRYKIP